MTYVRALEMFQSGQGADCVIEVTPQIDGQDPEKKEFNVHKFVLMVNSDVFLAMFSHENTKEAREGRIQITDSTGTAVRHMLIYMYTGELPKEYAIETDAGPLMYIANKYEIQSLIQSIEQGLVNSLSLTNVIDRLEMADLYQLHSLYSSCGRLIRSNLQMVKKEEKWLELKKKAPELVFAILEEDVDEFGNEKSKRICNPVGNVWSSNRNVTISVDGLVASKNTNGLQNIHIYAQKEFPISVDHCRADGFPGTICYYFEVKTLSERCVVGLLDGGFNSGITLGGHANTYSIENVSTKCRYKHPELPLPAGARQEPPNVQVNIYGSGILICPDNKVTIFFTLNGILLVDRTPSAVQSPAME